MIVKCGRIEYEINDKDIIFFNGACYMLITRKQNSGWGGKISPVLAKNKAKKLIKEGFIKEVELKKPPYIGEHYKYYKLKNDCINDSLERI